MRRVKRRSLDVLMRETTILGAYKQGVEKLGLSHEEATERARDINYDVNFDYSAANALLMIRAGSVATQQMFRFQKYPSTENLKQTYR